MCEKIKTLAEYLAEVQEFLPDARSDDGISIVALSGAFRLRFHTPAEVGPRKELKPWLCVYFRAGEFDQCEIVELSRGLGKTALIAFTRTFSATEELYDIYRSALTEISSISTTSNNEPTPIK